MEKHKPYGPYEKFIKRPLDVICALLALIVFCWLYAIVAILVRVKLGSPVLFKQDRPGKDEKIFKLYKFRTMTDERDDNGELLPDEVRLTKFGKFLRKSSLDELPEAINILKGNMSVVGPRPLLVKYRHYVRPGLTGLAQVNGRNALSWEKKFSLDYEYVMKVTFTTDIKVILLTVIKSFIKQEGITLNNLEDFDEYRKKQDTY